MPGNVKALRRRLRSIISTNKITAAMQTVSAAKLKRAQASLAGAKPYAARLRAVFGHLAEAGVSGGDPLTEARPVRARTIVAVTADRGLAGGFNNLVIKRVESILRASPVPANLVCIGKKGYDHFKSRKWPIAFAEPALGGQVTAAESASITDRLAAMFTSGQTDEVVVVHNAFISTLSYSTNELRLLPLNAETPALAAPAAAERGDQAAAEGQTPAGKLHADYILEPTPDRLFAALLPRFLRNSVHMMLLDNFTAEHSARMTAMTNATRNGNDLITSVSLQMNKARQAAITTEILEVVSGADALSG